jgi:uncharacterized protein
MGEGPFHRDELTAQARAKVHPYAAGIRPFMPDQHRQFFEQLPYLFVSVPDENGWPLATILTGPPGFVHAPSPTVLRIDALAAPLDPAAAGFRPGNQIGILGLDLATRRRNRANGRIATLDGRGFTVGVAQSYGNCAQYIQARTIRPTAAPVAIGETIEVSGLDADARRLIETSDTFFVASRSREAAGDSGGLDISHRGGVPGFVGIDGNTLSIPDFKGNRFFNTLGNFLGDDRGGLLFVDFETGDLLQAAGRVTIDWDPEPRQRPTAAQRLWRIEITRSWWRRGALRFAWAFGDYAPTTLATAA